MARPVKHNLDYFPLDVGFFNDHKLLMIEEDFGVKGGYLAVRLMAMVYQQGYYLEWKDKSEISCAKRVGNGFTGALVCEILNSCLKHGLFDQRVFTEHGVLTSRGIQKRWIQVMIGIRRKVEISSELNLITSEVNGVSSEETTTPATFSTQKERKGKEIKEEKITQHPDPEKVKQKAIAPDKPSPPKINSNRKKEEQPEPYWDLLVKTWFDFGKEKFKEPPSFAGADPKIFKRIIERLKKRASQKNQEWNETSAPKRLKLFLTSAFEDPWLSKHFLLKNLESQFDTVVQKQASATQLKQTVPTGKIIPGITSDLQYLYERLCEGAVITDEMITMNSVIQLSSRNLITIPRNAVMLEEKMLVKQFLLKQYEDGATDVFTIKPKLQAV
jgi:hypothetical protein